MVEMTKRTRIEILVDAPLTGRLVKLAEDAGITGHTLLRTVSGRGGSGEWQEDLVSGATTKFIFLTVANSERAERFMQAIFPLLESHGLLVLQSEVEVVRPERF